MAGEGKWTSFLPERKRKHDRYDLNLKMADLQYMSAFTAQFGRRRPGRRSNSS
jgi:hypothetical protein